MLDIFLVDTSKAGYGQLTVKIKQNTTRLLHDQLRIDDHLYEVTFLPEFAIPLTVELNYNGENACKSIDRSSRGL